VKSESYLDISHSGFRYKVSELTEQERCNKELEEKTGVIVSGRE
jgi:hypothetical protein